MFIAFIPRPISILSNINQISRLSNFIQVINYTSYQYCISKNEVTFIMGGSKFK